MDTIRRSMQYSNGPGKIQKVLTEMHYKKYDELQHTYLVSTTEYPSCRTPFEPTVSSNELFYKRKYHNVDLQDDFDASATPKYTNIELLDHLGKANNLL
ncbi:hypothetical protein MFLAVUS_003672 [Mucor flavus]|uniref:Uncharacterized protein n=1 Tax=Mucor flavus TaxID=439312 RepID=A0ABP9YTQ6_9FUNG